MGEFSVSHMLIVALILLIFFGPSRLPALGQSIGKAIKGFKDGMNEVHNDNDKTAQNQPAPPAAVPTASQISDMTVEDINIKKADNATTNKPSDHS